MIAKPVTDCACYAFLCNILCLTLFVYHHQWVVYAFSLLLAVQASVTGNAAISAFDHPTLFDAVCSPTFGQILQPQPANQSNLLIQPESQSESPLQPQSLNSQSAATLQPIPALNQSQSPSQLLSPSPADRSKSPSHFFDPSLIENEDMSDLFTDEVNIMIVNYNIGAEIILLEFSKFYYI